ncbi:MAG TPA: acetylxylan esterase, partial [Clostridia bacterium]|nr:acetylxylan esterase [Clostridia bacterium]
MTELSGEERLLLAYEDYDRRMHRALAGMPVRRPWLEEDRSAIKDCAERLLGIKPGWIPKIRAQALRERKRDGYSVWDLAFTSWPGVAGTAHWYVPEGESGPRPLALLFCGHGAGCKHAPGYQAMARRLARQGMVVLVPDNMGQGERAPMGHHDVMAPFDCGLTFQGMLAMEGMALLDWAVQQPGIDPARVGLLGNSGGGALSLLVGALSPLATVVAPSGYPNSFEGFLRKDKVHCACNVLPGMLGRLEMWHILS